MGFSSGRGKAGEGKGKQGGSVDPQKVIETKVRSTQIKLVSYNRALELCARMNRETEILDFIDQIPEGEVLYDLGACEGRFSVYAALRGVRCFSFEPENENFQALLENCSLNRDRFKGMLSPFKVGVGEESENSVLKIGQPWAGGHQKVIGGGKARKDLDFDYLSEQEVQVVSLDDFMEGNQLPPPNFLKVDVDGSEWAFILGASRLLGRGELKKIIFELYEKDANYRKIVKTLEENGFVETAREPVEPGLFNILFEKRVPSNERTITNEVQS